MDANVVEILSRLQNERGQDIFNKEQNKIFKSLLKDYLPQYEYEKIVKTLVNLSLSGQLEDLDMKDSNSVDWIENISISVTKNLKNIIEMVSVKGGTFWMGNDDYRDNKGHKVILNSFEISKYPITKKQWDIVMNARPSKQNGNNFPINNISWYDAILFCNRLSIKAGFNPYYKIDKTIVDLNNKNKFDKFKYKVECDNSSNGYRLPTEAEWEFSARGGMKRKEYKYSGSNNINHVGWYIGNSEMTIHEVGKKKCNSLGLFDMSGNVLEWCYDWYSKKTPKGGANPKGISYGMNRVLRGGGYNRNSDNCTIYKRSCDSPLVRKECNGLRVCRSIISFEK